MRCVIESGGRFPGSKGERPGLYLGDYNIASEASDGARKASKELDTRTMLTLAMRGAIGSGVLSIEQGLVVQDGVEAQPTRSLFRVAKHAAPIVRFVLGGRFREFIDSSGGALKPRIMAEGVMGTSLEDQNNYQAMYDFGNNKDKALPIHVTNQGFLQSAPDKKSPYTADFHGQILSRPLYAASLNDAQSNFARSRVLNHAGQYVPLEVNNQGEPVIIGELQPTLGVRNRDGRYVPHLMYIPETQSWMDIPLTNE